MNKSLCTTFPSIHQIYTLEKTKFCQYCNRSHVWFHVLLMQQKLTHQRSFRCIARPNLSSISTFLWLFLHLNLFPFFFDITSKHSTELKWLMLNKTQKMIPFIMCEISFGQYVCEFFFVSICLIWIWGPNWFYRKTNQELLCGFLKNVSLSGFFPLWSSWSLLRCPQRYITKLPDEKNTRSKKWNQHCLDHQSLHEIFLVFGIVWACERTSRLFFHKSTCSKRR